MNSFEHPRANKEFPTSNEINFQFTSLLDIPCSILVIQARGQRPRCRATPKHRPERAELQRKPWLCSPYRAESFHTFTHGAAMGYRVSAPLGLNAKFNTKVSTTFEACLTFSSKDNSSIPRKICRSRKCRVLKNKTPVKFSDSRIRRLRCS